MDSKAALALAFGWLSRRPLTIHQLCQRLERSGVTPAAAQAVVRRLIELNYLDDRSYARDFVEQRHRRQGWGRRRLKPELVSRGVAEEIIEEVLGSLDESAEFTRALSLAQDWKGRTSLTRPKLFARLIRRGIAPAAAARVAGLIFPGPAHPGQTDWPQIP